MVPSAARWQPPQAPVSHDQWSDYGRRAPMQLASTIRAVDDARRAFRDWPHFLYQTLSGRNGGSDRQGTVRTRKGTTISFVNTPLGRAPLWEVFASDDYPWALLRPQLTGDDAVVLDIGA